MTVNTAGYRTINIAVKKTDMVGVKFVEVFHAHAPQALAASSGLKRLSDYDSTPKPFSGTFRSDRNYSMSIHRGQNQLGGNSSTTDRISFYIHNFWRCLYWGNKDLEMTHAWIEFFLTAFGVIITTLLGVIWHSYQKRNL